MPNNSISSDVAIDLNAKLEDMIRDATIAYPLALDANTLRPVRLEDVEDVSRDAVRRMLNDLTLRDTLEAVVAAAVRRAILGE